MFSRRFFFFTLGLAVLIVTVSLYWPNSTPKVYPKALMSFIDAGDAPAVLDVRTKWEFASGHVPGAIHAPVFALFRDHGNLAISQQETLVVYCGTGFRARVGALFLRLAGYESVYLLKGHLKMWRANGFPVILPAQLS